SFLVKALILDVLIDLSHLVFEAGRVITEEFVCNCLNLVRNRLGCKSYSIAPCAHHVESNRPSCTGIDTPTPSCVKQCDAASSLSYSSDLSFGDTAYTVDNDEKQIQKEILTNGPVEATFYIFPSSAIKCILLGVYQHVAGDLDGGHAVKIIGWGVENDTPYWLAANSWNSDWGDKGYFKILRGEDHMGIESYIVAGTPKL
ncbi:hypothetical protein NQ318_013295, partial [Aromia moschata]